MGTYQTNKISLSVFDDKRLSMHKNANQTKPKPTNKIKSSKQKNNKDINYLHTKRLRWGWSFVLHFSAFFMLKMFM